MLTCKQMDELLDSRMGLPGLRLPEPFQAHLDSCARCRHLFTALSAETPATSNVDNVSRQIAARLTDGLKPVKPLSSTPVSALRVITVFLLITAALLGGLGTAAVKGMTSTQMTAFLLMAAAGVIALAFSLSWQVAPGARHRWRPAFLLAGLSFAVVFCFLFLFPWPETSRNFAGGWQCARSGVALAIPAGLLLWLTIRRGEPLALPTLGATVGGAAALIAVLILQFNCPKHEALHLTLWHAGILLVCMGLGALVGWVCQMWPRRSLS